MFSLFDLNSTEGREKYCSVLSSQKFVNPYYLLDYMKVFSGGLERLNCFCYVDNEKYILMPGYLYEVKSLGAENSYFDFITPYGYTGPYMSESITSEDVKFFWENVDSWYRNNNIISEFIRFSLDNNYIGYNGQLHSTMLNIKGKILQEETQWSSFDHKVRKNVKRAQKENLMCKIFYKEEITSKEIFDFFSIYIKTMERTNADAKFFYPLSDFELFIKNNPLNSVICNIYSDNIIISSELVLVSEDSIYSFLGGTDENYFDKRPNDYLKYEMINWARNNGKNYYILGGGYGYEDGIFKYKKSFFPNDIEQYYTGRKMINKDIYYKLFELNNKDRADKGLNTLDINDTSFFPIYNKKN